MVYRAQQPHRRLYPSHSFQSKLLFNSWADHLLPQELDPLWPIDTIPHHVSLVCVRNVSSQLHKTREDHSDGSWKREKHQSDQFDFRCVQAQAVEVSEKDCSPDL